MRKIDAYVRSSVLNAILMVLLVLAMLDMVFALLDQLDDMKNEYGITQVLYYVVLSTPTRLYEYFPMATLIGVLAGLGSLASNSELTAIRAAGVSTHRILMSAMKPAAIMMVAGLILGEYVVPNLESISTSYRTIAQGKSEVENNRGKGYWHREGNSFMRFKAIEPNGVLHGINRYDFDAENNLQTIVYATRATYQRKQWLLENVTETHIEPYQTHIEKYASKDWQTKLTPENLQFVAQSASFMAISTLYHYSQYLEQQGLNGGEYLLAFWKKVLQPLSTFALVLVGISFIFGPMRSVGMGQRLFSGILVGLIYKFSVDLLGPAGLVFGFGAFWANIIPVIVCIGIGVLLLRRAG